MPAGCATTRRVGKNSSPAGSAGLAPLPAEPFVYGEWKVARVNIDYHVEVAGHYYSVPHALVHMKVDVRSTALTVEIFTGGNGWPRTSGARPGASTPPSPPICRRPTSATGSGAPPGSWPGHEHRPQTAQLAQAILAARPHPEQGYRSCLGLFRLGRRDGRAAGSRLCPGPGRGCALVPARRCDPEARPRPGAAVGGRPGSPVRRSFTTRCAGHVLRVTERRRGPMLSPPTMEKLQTLKLTTMAAAWTAQQQDRP